MADAFKTFKKYAFRLELFPFYNVEYDMKPFHEWQKTGQLTNWEKEFLKTKNLTKVPDKETRDWLANVMEKEKQGAKMQRVQVVEFPLSDYLKWEITSYIVNVKAGEEIKILLKKRFDEELKPKINFDFWLFDDSLVLKMNYDKDYRFIGAEEITENIYKFIELKNKLWEKAIPLAKFRIG